jgi:hypothetical protein
VGFLHSDDFFPDEKVLEDIVGVFENDKVAGVYGDLKYVNAEDSAKVVRNWVSKPFKRSNLKYGWMPPHPTLFLRKAVYSDLRGFNTEYRIAADYDFILINQSMVDHTSRFEIIRKKDEIFRKHIHKPLARLVDNIIFSFKLFRSGVDIKTLHNDCMSHVIEKFCNFDPDQNTKSFSFYGTVAKHYLQNKKKEVDKSTKVTLDYEAHSEEAEELTAYELDDESDLDSSLALFNHIIDIFEGEIERNDISKNDAKVAEAIVDIFRSHEIVGIYSKSSVYKLIKEHTNLETKDITYSLHRFKVLYKIKRQEFVQKHKDKYYGHDDDMFYH